MINAMPTAQNSFSSLISSKSNANLTDNGFGEILAAAQSREVEVPDK